MKTIYYLSDYYWYRGTIVGGGKKNHKIRDDRYENEFYVSKDKCAEPGELVCIVWEMWRGVNGRGGYRVERVLYPEHRVPAEKVYFQPCGAVREHVVLGRVNENEKPCQMN